jgi:hypothetical protein
MIVSYPEATLWKLFEAGLQAQDIPRLFSPSQSSHPCSLQPQVFDYGTAGGRLILSAAACPAPVLFGHWARLFGISRDAWRVPRDPQLNTVQIH